MKKNKNFAILTMVFFTIATACGSQDDSKNEAYSCIISELDDDASYAFLEMDYPEDVLVTTEQTYDSGDEESAAVQCKVYYLYNNEVLELGTIESLSTAYPISFTKDAIWAGDNTAIRKYEIENGELLELEDSSDEYLSSQVIHFGCGASDCINSIIKTN